MSKDGGWGQVKRNSRSLKDLRVQGTFSSKSTRDVDHFLGLRKTFAVTKQETYLIVAGGWGAE